MAPHLVEAGHEVTVWTRTAAKSNSFAEGHRAKVAQTPADAAAGCEAVISIVVDGPQVEHVLLGPAGAVSGAPPGTLFIDMSTTAPASAVSIGAAIERRGHQFLDAPVTGSSPAAESGTLTIMVGGEGEQLERARPLLESMGRRIIHTGPTGHGQLVKLLNNAVAIANAITAAQALVAGRALDVDLDALVEVLGAGSGASAVLDLKAPALRAHDYSPMFKTEHMLKDVRHCLDALAPTGAPFPAAAEACSILAAAVGAGYGEADYASVLEVLEARAGIRI